MGLGIGASAVISQNVLTSKIKIVKSGEVRVKVRILGYALSVNRTYGLGFRVRIVMRQHLFMYIL